jgi:signal transduction histidine kinase
MTTLEQIVGQVIFDVFPDNPDDAGATGTSNLRESLERVVNNRVPDTMAVQKYDIQQPAEAGGEFEVRYWSPVSSPVIGPDGRVAYILVQTQDVTDYMRLKEHEIEHRALTSRLQERTQRMEADIVARSSELQEANRLLRAADAARNQFLSRVSHELRTPLNIMLGFGELLSLGEITAEHRDWVTMILKAGRELLCLLDEVLEISRIESGSLTLSVEPVSAHQVIAEALDLVRPLAASAGMRLETGTSGPREPARASRLSAAAPGPAEPDVQRRQIQPPRRHGYRDCPAPSGRSCAHQRH